MPQNRSSLTPVLSVFLCAAMLAITACAQIEPGGKRQARAPGTIEVTATPVPLNVTDPGEWRAGKLKYRGGLWLRSEDSRFGGISGLRWLSTTQNEPGMGPKRVERLLAITDRGKWLLIQPLESDHRLRDIGTVVMGDLTGIDGKPLKDLAEADTESLTLNRACGNTAGNCMATGAIVGFERNHRLMLYDLMPGGRFGGVVLDLKVAQPYLKAQPGNGGIEAMAGSATHMRIFSEHVRDGEDRATGIDLSCQGCDIVPNREQRFSVALPHPFKPTDADWSPQGQMLLGRALSPLEGVGARIDLVVEKDGLPIGELINLATLYPPVTSDNFEGLAVRVEAGRTFVYIVSDDNFSPFQRTLLLKFEMMKD